jgi:hypothetical protein
MAEPFRGGCFCGAPLVVWANAPGHAFRIAAGSPAGYASSDRWVRHFRRACGAPVYGRQPDPSEEWRR